MKRTIAYTFPLSTGVLLQKIAPKKGPGQKNSSTRSRWPYYQAVGWVQQEKTTGRRPVYLGGLLLCHTKGVHRTPRVILKLYPQTGRMVSVV